MTENQLQLIVTWAVALYRKRTEAVENGSAPLDWMAVGFRVRWNDIEQFAKRIDMKLTAKNRADIMRKYNEGIRK